MSLYGALYSGVAGLTSQSNRLGVISDNIANVNTVGYKAGAATFETLVTSSGAAAYSPGGVLGGNNQLVDTQGLLQTTTSPTDIAISGGGFFVVNERSDQAGQVLYTRAGSFTQDSLGNFRNTSGLFLQAWPLDRDGRLPGAPGNLNTNSSANLSSLETVNVRNVTGTASPTTSVSIGANLQASQTAFTGAGGLADLDNIDTFNFPLRGKDIIVPTTINDIVRGDTFTVTTGAGPSYTYNYGGFSFSRNITTGAVGDSTLALTPQSATLYNATQQVGAGGFTTISTAANASVIRATVPSTASLRAGDWVTITGETATIDGVTPAQINGARQILTIVNGTQFTFASSGTAINGNGTDSGGGGVGVDATANPLRSVGGTRNIVVSHAGHGRVSGDVIRLSGITTNLGNIPANELNDRFVVTFIDADHYQITVPTTTALTSTSGGTGTITSTIRQFDSLGRILDAQNASQPFLGVSGTANFTTAALSFQVSTPAAGTVTFTYTATAPNTQLAQFNSLNTLAEAINNVSGLSARVTDGRIWIGPSDATAQISFTNGSVAGTSGPPVRAGIDWVRELGLVTTVPQALNRFNSLESLNNLINLSAGLQGTLTNPLGNSSLSINVLDPLDTITFADGTGNTGSLLAQLGLVNSLNGAAFTVQNTGAIGPAYDPGDSAKNMASGSIAPQFSRPVTVYDALGTPHSLNIAFLKTRTNSWAVEVYAQPAADVNTALPNGQIANGTVEFNGDGSLRLVSNSLTGSKTINWTNGSSTTGITLNWGTQGSPFGTPNATDIGLTDGLSQFDSAYNVNFVNQNGAPVGQLTGISIDANGFISASYNNGETARLYKIPLASFTDPNNLDSVSGNAFAQSNGSGNVNLKEAGSSGVGTLSAGALELSNVELAGQLTDMIVAQRAYQANTKIIQTADSLLNALDQLIR